MATTGPPLYPGSSTFPGSTTYPGQGTTANVEVLYSTDDLTNATPNWTYANAYLRSFNTSRGRNSELDEIDAGTASIMLDNRTRVFDPVNNPLIRPRNRWWVRAKFNGITSDIFKGYATSYAQTWPSPPNDAVAVVQCVDELAVLAMDGLPVTEPPRDTYADVVLADFPAGYWRCKDLPSGSQLAGTAGPVLTAVPGSLDFFTPPAILGESDWAIILTAGNVITMDVDSSTVDFDLWNMASFAFELWFQTSTVTPAGGDFLASGPNTAGGFQWELSVDATGHIVGKARNSVPTTFTVTSGTISPNTWYHVVLTITGGNLTLFVNGASVASTAWSGVFADATASAQMALGDLTGVSSFVYDEVAFYRGPLSVTRVAAHYTAGTQRGFLRNTSSNRRIADILDAAQNHAPRSLRVGAAAFLRGKFMHGQSPLDEMKAARDAENIDALMFAGRDGTITFLDRDHRSSDPWKTIQIVFDDDGTDLPYLDLDLDYSDSFLLNEITVSREGGTVIYVSKDQASIDAYGKHSLSLETISNADDAAIAPALLAKHKNPFSRIIAIQPNMDNVNVLDAVLQRELGDKIEIIRRPPGGGTPIDQAVWIQKIDIAGAPGVPLAVKLGVSPR